MAVRPQTYISGVWGLAPIYLGVWGLAPSMGTLYNALKYSHLVSLLAQRLTVVRLDGGRGFGSDRRL